MQRGMKKNFHVDELLKAKDDKEYLKEKWFMDIKDYENNHGIQKVIS